MTFQRLSTLAAVGILLLYGMLIASAFYFFDPVSAGKNLADKRVLHALLVSVGAASIATALAVLLAVPAAFALSRYRFRLKPLADLFLEFPMIVSPAALGAMLLIFFQTPLGLVIREHVIDVVYTFWGIVLAQFITVLGISTRLIKAVFDEIPVRYEQIARTMGASAPRAFRDISLPLAKQGILSAIVLTWAKAIGEFGATITLAGSMAMKTETLPTAIFMKLSMANITDTVALVMLLFGISITLLALTRFLLPSGRI